MKGDGITTDSEGIADPMDWNITPAPINTFRKESNDVALPIKTRSITISKLAPGRSDDHPSEFQLIPEPSYDARRFSKRERSNSPVSVADKKLKSNGYKKSFSVSSMSIPQVEDGPAQRAIIDLTGKLWVTASWFSC